MALKADGTLWAWGANHYGKLGDGTLVDKSTPTQIGVDTNWSAIAAGGHYSIALRANGTLWAWGGNGYGEAGQWTLVSATNSPTQTGVDNNWASIAADASSSHTIALKTDGTL